MSAATDTPEAPAGIEDTAAAPPDFSDKDREAFIKALNLHRENASANGVDREGGMVAGVMIRPVVETGKTVDEEAIKQGWLKGISDIQNDSEIPPDQKAQRLQEIINVARSKGIKREDVVNKLNELGVKHRVVEGILPDENDKVRAELPFIKENGDIDKEGFAKFAAEKLNESGDSIETTVAGLKSSEFLRQILTGKSDSEKAALMGALDELQTAAREAKTWSSEYADPVKLNKLIEDRAAGYAVDDASREDGDNYINALGWRHDEAMGRAGLYEALAAELEKYKAISPEDAKAEIEKRAYQLSEKVKQHGGAGGFANPESRKKLVEEGTFSQEEMDVLEKSNLIQGEGFAAEFNKEGFKSQEEWDKAIFKAAGGLMEAEYLNGLTEIARKAYDRGPDKEKRAFEIYEKRMAGKPPKREGDVVVEEPAPGTEAARPPLEDGITPFPPEDGGNPPLEDGTTPFPEAPPAGGAGAERALTPEENKKLRLENAQTSMTEARDKYIQARKAARSTRRIIGNAFNRLRGKENSLDAQMRAAGEVYDKSRFKFAALKAAYETPENKANKDAYIDQLSLNAASTIANEMKNFSAAELAANENKGRLQKLAQFLQRHPGARIAISAGIYAGLGLSVASGNVPLAAALLGARTALGAMMNEGLMDKMQMGYSRKFGDLKEQKEETIRYERDSQGDIITGPDGQPKRIVEGITDVRDNLTRLQAARMEGAIQTGKETKDANLVRDKLAIRLGMALAREIAADGGKINGADLLTARALYKALKMETSSASSEQDLVTHRRRRLMNKVAAIAIAEAAIVYSAANSLFSGGGSAEAPTGGTPIGESRPEMAATSGHTQLASEGPATGLESSPAGNATGPVGGYPEAESPAGNATGPVGGNPNIESSDMRGVNPGGTPLTDEQPQGPVGTQNPDRLNTEGLGTQTPSQTPEIMPHENETYYTFTEPDPLSPNPNESYLSGKAQALLYEQITGNSATPEAVTEFRAQNPQLFDFNANKIAEAIRAANTDTPGLINGDMVKHNLPVRIPNLKNVVGI